MSAVIVRVVCILVGIPLLCIALFTYKDETGAIQNRLESIWIKLNDRTKAVGSRIVAIFNVVAGTDTSILDRIFGPRLLSLRVIGVSSTASTMAVLVFVVAFARVAPRMNLQGITFKVTTILAWTIAALLLLLLPAIISRSTFAVIPTLLVPSATVFFFVHNLIFQDPNDHWSGIFSSATLVSIMSDIAANAIIRRSIKSMRYNFRLSGIVKAVFKQIGWVLVFPIVPLLLGFTRAWGHMNDSYAHTLAAIGVMNLTTALLCLAFIGSLLAFSAYILVWPILERLFYPVAEMGVISNRKLLGGIATVLLLHGFHLTSGLIKVLVETLGK